MHDVLRATTGTREATGGSSQLTPHGKDLDLRNLESWSKHSRHAIFQEAVKRFLDLRSARSIDNAPQDAAKVPSLPHKWAEGGARFHCTNHKAVGTTHPWKVLYSLVGAHAANLDDC